MRVLSILMCSVLLVSLTLGCHAGRTLGDCERELSSAQKQIQDLEAALEAQKQETKELFETMATMLGMAEENAQSAVGGVKVKLQQLRTAHDANLKKLEEVQLQLTECQQGASN